MGEIGIQNFLTKQQKKLEEQKEWLGNLEQTSDKLKAFVKNIESLSYYRQIRTHGLRVASILDEFSHLCFKYDCELLSLSATNWADELTAFRPDFLFVESAWAANNKEWQYEVANLHMNAHRTKLKKLIDFCKYQGIPTVFWDKEGSGDFDFFKEAASYFDIVTTADETNIPNLISYCGHERVYVLGFAAQPQIHNPIHRYAHQLGRVAFSGSYYSHKYPSRQRDMETIVKPSLAYKTDIFDRNYNKESKLYEKLKFPQEYRKNIVGRLDYAPMVEAYKNYKIFLNVNSIQNSDYMFSRRVFELLASQTFVISGASKGVEKLFEGIVPISRSKEETIEYLRIYLSNDALRTKATKEGLRNVMQNHTYKHRLQTLCDLLKLDKDILSQPKPTIIVSTNRDVFMDNLYDSIEHQTFTDFDVVIILNKGKSDVNKWEQKFSNLSQTVTFKQLDESKTLGECLNEAAYFAEGDVLVKFDDDDYYAPNYLLDMMIAMDYSNADIVGKTHHFVYLEEKQLLVGKKFGDSAESYSRFIAGATLVIKKDVLE